MSNCFKHYENDVDSVRHLRMWKGIRSVGMTKHLTGLIGDLHTDKEVEVQGITAQQICSQY
jgi:hypothetical protein